MKNIFNYIIAIIIVTFGFVSCTQEEKVIDQAMEYKTGGILRTLKLNGVVAATSLTTANITYSNPSSAFSLELEAIDNANGEKISKIESYVAFKKNSAPSAPETAQVLFNTFDKPQLVTSLNGLPQLNYSTTLGAIATKLNLTSTQFSTGDRFIIYFKLYLNDGSVYSVANTNPTVIGNSYFRSPFKYTLTII